MPLNDDQIKEIRSLADVHQRAANSISEHLSTLWQTRLNMALTVNDDDLIRNALLDPSTVSYMDTNCGCGGGGGGPASW
jgi:hypothetical protein